MTRKREDVIKRLKDIRIYTGENVREAFDMAIEALEQSIPLSVIEDIKAVIRGEIASRESGKPMVQNCGLHKALEIIDRHISGKENIDAGDSN